MLISRFIYSNGLKEIDMSDFCLVRCGAVDELGAGEWDFGYWGRLADGADMGPPR